MQVDLNRVIEQVSKEKGIDKTIVINAVEEMMHSAARRTFGPDRNIESRFNPELGEIELFEIKTVVEKVANAAAEADVTEARAKYDPEAEVGDEILIKLDTATMGRIAAQAAKQNLIQHIRDAERKQIFNEFKDRKQEVVSGIVQRFERKNMIVNLGRTEAILPEKEQIPHERYRQGDRIRALILDVDLSEKGLSIVLSRTSNDFLMKLFEQEVPEIYEGIVEIRQSAREPGGRAKVAVYSKDSDVDPVGACVGMKGTRVQSVVQELRGEKIDIVPWTDDQAELVCRALAPAKVSKVIIDEDEHAMEVIVPDDQLSLAIGKRGQNVRLAHRLTGWKLDVRSEAEAEEEARSRARRSTRSRHRRYQRRAALPVGFPLGRAIVGGGRDGVRRRGNQRRARAPDNQRGARARREQEGCGRGESGSLRQKPPRLPRLQLHLRKLRRLKRRLPKLKCAEAAAETVILRNLRRPRRRRCRREM